MESSVLAAFLFVVSKLIICHTTLKIRKNVFEATVFSLLKIMIIRKIKFYD
jgi:hypothetical protein